MKNINLITFIFISCLGVSACGWLHKELNLSGDSKTPTEPSTSVDPSSLAGKVVITAFEPSLSFIERGPTESRTVTLSWASTGDACVLTPRSSEQATTLPGSGSIEVAPERTQKFSLICTKKNLKFDTLHTWVRVLTRATKLQSCTDLLVAVPNDDRAILVLKKGDISNNIAVPNGTLLPRTALLPNAEGNYQITLNNRAFTVLSNFVQDPCDATKYIVRTVEIVKDTTFTEIGGIRKCNFEAGDILRAHIVEGTDSESLSPLTKVTLLDAATKCDFKLGSFLKTDVRTGFGYEGDFTETGRKIAVERTRVRFNAAFVVKTTARSGLAEKDTTSLEWTTSNAESCTSTTAQNPTPTSIPTNFSILFDAAKDTDTRITCDGPGGPATITPKDIPLLIE